MKNLFKKIDEFIRIKIDGNLNYNKEDIQINFDSRKEKIDRHKIMGEFFAHQLIEVMEKSLKSNKLEEEFNNTKAFSYSYLLEANLSFNDYSTISFFINNDFFKNEKTKELHKEILDLMFLKLTSFRANDFFYYLKDNSNNIYNSFINNEEENLDKYLLMMSHDFRYQNEVLDNNLKFLLENEKDKLIKSMFFIDLINIKDPEIKNIVKNIIIENPKEIMNNYFDEKTKYVNQKEDLIIEILYLKGIKDKEVLYTLINSIKEEIDINKVIDYFKHKNEFPPNYIEIKRVIEMLEANNIERLDR